MDLATCYASSMRMLTIVPSYYPPMDIRFEYTLLTAILCNRWRAHISFCSQVRLFYALLFHSAVSLFLSLSLADDTLKNDTHRYYTFGNTEKAAKSNGIRSWIWLGEFNWFQSISEKKENPSNARTLYISHVLNDCLQIGSQNIKCQIYHSSIRIARYQKCSAFKN